MRKLDSWEHFKGKALSPKEVPFLWGTPEYMGILQMNVLAIACKLSVSMFQYINHSPILGPLETSI
jgi:hypothetical protein